MANHMILVVGMGNLFEIARKAKSSCRKSLEYTPPDQAASLIPIDRLIYVFPTDTVMSADLVANLSDKMGLQLHYCAGLPAFVPGEFTLLVQAQRLAQFPLRQLDSQRKLDILADEQTGWRFNFHLLKTE